VCVRERERERDSDCVCLCACYYLCMCGRGRVCVVCVSILHYIYLLGPTVSQNSTLIILTILDLNSMISDLDSVTLPLPQRHC
jgi:hypothetical protein